MNGRTLATARWRRLDGEGDDTCRLVEEPGGYMLIGHARMVQDRVRAALDYVVQCDTDWRSQGAAVSGTFGESELGWQFRRDADGWAVNGAAVPGTGGCADIDLGFTPATNLLPLRRLHDALDRPQEVSALWLRWPRGDVAVLDQSYHRAGGVVRYASPGFAADLTVHSSGFVTHYPGGWEGAVDAP